MEKSTINPNLAKLANFLYTDILYSIKEYQKDKLTEDSYIFAPNHTNNLDGYIIWSLLAKDYEIDTFMYKEFWDHFPIVAKVLPLFHVYPISRDKIQPKEIKTELRKLKDSNHSLVIFPQGRHVDPALMLQYPDYHFTTIPLGAFYIASKSGKPIMPIFMEPQKLGKENAVIYGTPIFPQDYSLYQDKTIKKENMITFAKAWLDEINNLYQSSEELTGRKMHPYRLEKAYTDASGLRYGKMTDPNIIMNYTQEIEQLKQIYNETGISDIAELCEISHLSPTISEKIQEVEKTYQKCLKKH